MATGPWDDLISLSEIKSAPPAPSIRVTKEGEVWTPEANRGMVLENLVIVANTQYDAEGRGLITKQEVKWKVEGYDYKTRKARRVYPAEKSTVDWTGGYVDRFATGLLLSVAFETKESNDETYWDIGEKQLKPHQLDFLIAQKRQNGLAFLLVWSAVHDRCYLVDPDWVAKIRSTVSRYAKKKGCALKEPQYRSTIRWDELDQALGKHAWIVPWRMGFPDYFEVIDALRRGSLPEQLSG